MAGLISDVLLDNLRVVAYRQLITPVIIQRNTYTTTDADSKKTWATIATTTGWLVGKNNVALDQMAGSRLVVDSGYELRLRQGTDIQPGDRVLINNEPYAVIDENSEVTISLFLKATLRRVS